MSWREPQARCNLYAMSMTALLELSGGSGLNQAHIHACRQGVRGWEIDSGDINFFRVGCASVMGAGRRFKRVFERRSRCQAGTLMNSAKGAGAYILNLIREAWLEVL
ncbi:hypothetical protein DFH09DRAFT_1086447 [Mycena vulgaris]|nr:hypothetical protein DFH09DRAFT_1086447 [Mycena vulgaris]